MKLESLAKMNNGDSKGSDLVSGNFHPTTDLEHLVEWVRLNASHVRNSAPCVERHRQSLRARGETEQRLKELNH